MPHVRQGLVIRYEDLRKDEEKELRRVIEFMGTPADREAVAEAVSYASFENMKRMEREGQLATDRHRFGSVRGSDGEAFKLRRAKVGGYRDYFTEDQAAYLGDLIQTHLTSELGYGESARIESSERPPAKTARSG